MKECGLNWRSTDYGSLGGNIIHLHSCHMEHDPHSPGIIHQCFCGASNTLTLVREVEAIEIDQKFSDLGREVQRRENARLKDKITSMTKIIKDLLTLVTPYPSKDIPETCGACGTPSSCCDGNCVDAAHMSEHNAIISRAKTYVGGEG